MGVTSRHPSGDQAGRRKKVGTVSSANRFGLGARLGAGVGVGATTGVGAALTSTISISSSSSSPAF